MILTSELHSSPSHRENSNDAVSAVRGNPVSNLRRVGVNFVHRPRIITVDPSSGTARGFGVPKKRVEHVARPDLVRVLEIEGQP